MNLMSMPCLIALRALNDENKCRQGFDDNIRADEPMAKYRRGHLYATLINRNEIVLLEYSGSCYEMLLPAW